MLCIVKCLPRERDLTLHIVPKICRMQCTTHVPLLLFARKNQYSGSSYAKQSIITMSQNKKAIRNCEHACMNWLLWLSSVVQLVRALHHRVHLHRTYSVVFSQPLLVRSKIVYNSIDTLTPSQNNPSIR